jgi:Raf kinase inhibitor-like YbhB/YbcL family protein
MPNDNKKMELRSIAFSQNGHIPHKYTCEGEDINPPLEISNIPENTSSLALIMDDPDAPGGVFDHWLVWNISPQNHITENTNPGTSGTNSFGKTGYGGPCPPSGSHRYFFKVYALDGELELPASSGKAELLEAMKGHVIGEAELMGLYKKHKHTAPY